jgi:hypothetical protein
MAHVNKAYGIIYDGYRGLCLVGLLDDVASGGDSAVVEMETQLGSSSTVVGQRDSLKTVIWRSCISTSWPSIWGRPRL